MQAVIITAVCCILLVCVKTIWDSKSLSKKYETLISGYEHLPGGHKELSEGHNELSNTQAVVHKDLLDTRAVMRFVDKMLSEENAKPEVRYKDETLKKNGIIDRILNARKQKRLEREEERYLEVAIKQCSLEAKNEMNFDTILDYATDIICNSKDENYRNHPIFSFMKVLTDKIVIENAYAFITDYKTIFGKDKSYIDLFNSNWEFTMLKEYIKPIKCNVTVDLATDPIITTVWRESSVKSYISGIKTDDNTWNEDTGNHRLKFLYPMCVGIVFGGNHSIFTGMIKKEGVLNITPESHHIVYDMSAAYDSVKFDGTYYIRKSGEDISLKANSFEFGCMFEIGRKIHERGIKFPGLEFK